MRKPLRALVVFVGVVALLMNGPALAATPSAKSADDAAAKLVRAALEAELAGNSAERAQNLHDAIKASPNYAPARWHSGQIQLDDEWLPVDEISRRLGSDERVAAYRQKRDALVDTADRQRELARWCDKQQLKDQARVHWTKVLEFSGADQEAIRALGLRMHGGLLVTREATERRKTWEGRLRKANRTWQSQFTKWRQAFNNGDATSVADAEARLRTLNDPAALPALVAVFAADGDTPKQAALNRHLVDTLARFPERLATEELLRMAVLSESAEARRLAAGALRSRPLTAFVPELVAALPTETTLEIRHITMALPGSVTSRFEVLERTPSEDNTVHHVLHAWHGNTARYATTQYLGTLARYASCLHGSQQLELQLHHAHQSAEQTKAELRRRIEAALRTSTGFEQVEERKEWLVQLAKHTESYMPAEFPIRGQRELRLTEIVTIITNLSCFPAGTPIQTSAGFTTIEQVHEGDLVLSQDPETGELALKPVIQLTLRPATPLIEIGIAGKSILATRGHPFWVNGHGWLMAKQLVVGQHLHTPDGGIAIENIHEKPAQEAYNLVVGDFASYFVGECRVLVHDNQRIAENAALVPGLLARDIQP